MPEDTRPEPRDVIEWMHGFFAERNTTADLDRPGADLFSDGLLDSLGVVALIVGLESRFGLHFTEDDLQDPRFSTVAGLAALVTEARRRAAVT